MTIEALLHFSAAELEAMFDQQLTEYFAPFFKVTRPELIERPVTGVKRVTTYADAKTRLGIEKLAALGIDASHLLKRRR